MDSLAFLLALLWNWVTSGFHRIVEALSPSVPPETSDEKRRGEITDSFRWEP